MKIIVGLGNPGKAYETTRHNAGFMAVDFTLKDSDDVRWQNNFRSLVAEPTMDAKKILFVKPQTFMNESGKAVKAICDFYKINLAEDLLVVHDDKDLPLGTIKTTDDSSAAGHKGVQNVIDALSTQNFHRIRIGVNLPGNLLPTEAFVLQAFAPEDFNKFNTEILPKVKLAVEKFIK